MPRSFSHTDCFAYFRTVPRNPRWSWSGRSADGSTVAITLWQDRFEEQGRIYRSWQTDRPGEWRSRPGFVELIDNLAHAREHLAGHVRVILAVAKDKDASPRSILRCFPHPDLLMHVAELDVEEGTFVLARL